MTESLHLKRIKIILKIPPKKVCTKLFSMYVNIPVPLWLVQPSLMTCISQSECFTYTSTYDITN